MPRPVNKERIAMRRMLVWGVMSVAFLIFVGQLILIFRPPDAVDKKCLGTVTIKLWRCIRDAQLEGLK